MMYLVEKSYSVGMQLNPIMMCLAHDDVRTPQNLNMVERVAV